MNLKEMFYNCLIKNNEAKMTARQIAEWIVENHKQECQKKESKSNLKNKTITDQISSEISANRLNYLEHNKNIKTIDCRPRLFYYYSKSDEEEIIEQEQPSKNNQQTQLSEHDLYPLFIEYLKSELKLYAMRIDERKSSNNRGENGNKWLHPDIVAMEDLTKKWGKAKECALCFGEKRAKLLSFEIKKILNPSNIRKDFFQTVSNSSWANYGYLVATEIREDIKSEIEMLSSLHGIGIIRLDIENPSESEIVIPAHERLNLDWSSINRIYEINSDFKKYINEFKDFCQTGKTKESDWD